MRSLFKNSNEELFIDLLFLINRDIQALTDAEEKAKNEGRGKYSNKKNQAQRDVITKFNNVDVFSQLKGKHENGKYS
jgi:hypothetical protein